MKPQRQPGILLDRVGPRGHRSLLRGQLAGNAMLTGGAFGIEGSLITLLLIAAGAAFYVRRA